MGSMVQRAAAVLIIGGLLVIVGYGLYYMLDGLYSDVDAPLAIKLAVTALLAGIALLLLYVAVDRIRTSKSESFEEVDE